MNTEDRKQKALDALDILGGCITTEFELKALDYLHDYIVSSNPGRMDMPQPDFVKMASKFFGMD